MVVRGIIGEYEDGISFEAFSDALDSHQGRDLTIKLDSPGGVVSDGLAIYNAIMAYEGRVTVHIDTMAGSIASVIACAADEVIMNSNAQFMIHRAWTVAMGNSGDLRQVVDQLDSLDAILADIYVEKAGSDRDHWMSLMEAETYMSAEMAKEYGFADSVHQVEKKRKPKAEAVAIQSCVIQAKARAKFLKMIASLPSKGDV
jgi:ATP-dependent protease ClpP protease subunit